MLLKACGVVVSVEELDVRAEQRKAWLFHCFAPSCIPLTPAPRCLSCLGDFTAAHLFWVFLLASKTLGRLIRSCLLYLRSVTETVVL